ncbi:MAG: hypothetical protein QF416_00600 [Candidatus Marinimicrobia bacterium]|nr:hypothetical protein [Candidatus Neomarinimicrobiota bacterium]
MKNVVEFEQTHKNLTFSIGTKLHADFRIRLKYEGMGQGKFLRWLVLQYAQKNPMMEELIELYKKDNGNLSKTRESKIKKELEKEKKVKKDFALSEDERQSIFDIIEIEMPDL